MAESDDRNVTKRYQVHRGGRGHPNTSHGRLYHNLGVRDLRELLDRKRQERDDKSDENPPPPDPSYNYLKDPAREDGVKERYNKGQAKKPGYHLPSTSKQVPATLENPFNIKVEFSTSTGQHTYTLDEGTTIPDLKHVPDHPERRSFRGKNRGQKGSDRFNTRYFKGKKYDEKPTETETSDDAAYEHQKEENKGKSDRDSRYFKGKKSEGKPTDSENLDINNDQKTQIKGKGSRYFKGKKQDVKESDNLEMFQNTKDANKSMDQNEKNKGKSKNLNPKYFEEHKSDEKNLSLDEATEHPKNVQLKEKNELEKCGKKE